MEKCIFLSIVDSFVRNISLLTSKERCSGNMLQIYGSSPLSKPDFNRVALRHGCSPASLLHIFGTPFYKSTYGGLLLYFQPTYHCFSFKTPKANNFLCNLKP